MRIPFAANAFIASAADTLQRLANGDADKGRALLDQVMQRAFPQASAEPATPPIRSHPCAGTASDPPPRQERAMTPDYPDRLEAAALAVAACARRTPPSRAADRAELEAMVRRLRELATRPLPPRPTAARAHPAPAIEMGRVLGTVAHLLPASARAA